MLYLVGKFIHETSLGNIWDFQGIFDSYYKAKKACRYKNYFIEEVKLNNELSDKLFMVEVEYPLLTKMKVPLEIHKNK